MKLLLNSHCRTCLGILAFIFLAGSIQGQIFESPRPAMYDVGYSTRSAPESCKAMQVYRYIPGSRFVTGWDMLIEEFEFDTAGRVTRWRKFQQVRGDVIWDAKYVYDAEGEISQEAIQRPGEDTWITRNYSYVYSNDGLLLSGEVRLGSGELVGKMLGTDDKNIRKYVEYPEDENRAVTYTYGLNGKVHSQKSAGGSYTYEYDAAGDLILQRQTINGKVQDVVYEITRNPQGQVALQIERNGSKERSVIFQYNEKGQLWQRRYNPALPREMRHYAIDGTLHDIIYYDKSGFPKELLAFKYQFHTK